MPVIHEASHGAIQSELSLIWGIPFVLIARYLIWGRLLYAAWEKKRIHDAVSNRRVIAVRSGSSRQMASCYIDTLPTPIQEGQIERNWHIAGCSSCGGCKRAECMGKLGRTGVEAVPSFCRR